jgi:hypothetical protein
MADQNVLTATINLADSLRDLPDLPNPNVARKRMLELIAVMKEAGILPRDGNWSVKPRP